MGVKVKIQAEAREGGEGRVHPVVFLSTRLNKYHPPPARGRHSARKVRRIVANIPSFLRFLKFFRKRRAPLPLHGM